MLVLPSRSIFILVVGLISLFPVATATCYWQNSTLAPNDPYSIARDDVACFPNQQNSPCCGTGWSCLSDGVCYIKQGTGDFYYRGTCTDRTWNSQQCPGWCFAQNSNTSIPLIKCKKSTGEDWYCCPGDPDCNCTDGKNAVKLGATQPVTVTVIGSTSWPGIQTATTSTSTGTRTSATISATTTSASAASAATSGTNIPVSSFSGNTHPVLPVVVGVGVGVAVLLLLGVAFFFWRRAKKRRAAAASSYRQGSGENSPFMQGDHRRNVSTPGEGYYATQVISEKDGSKAFPTQELDAHGSRSREYGYIDVKRTTQASREHEIGMVEMDASRKNPKTEVVDGRVELA